MCEYSHAARQNVSGYDPARIQEKFTYAVQARIEVDGKLLYISDRHYAVLTQGAPAHVDLQLKAVGSWQTPILSCRILIYC